MIEQKTIKYFMLNNLGIDWIYEAENEEQATKELIYQVCYAVDIEEYEKYCESVGVEGEIEWEECGKYGFKASPEILTDSRGRRYHTFVFDNGEEES